MAENRLCAIPECNKPALWRGWCSSHYQRWRVHGDPRAGGTFRGEALRYLKEVVLTYERGECLFWPFAKNDKGQGQIRYEGRRQYVPRIVCTAERGPAPAPDYEAAHSCGNGHLGCVARRHLSWKTHAENMADMLIHGTSAVGERHGIAKLTDAQAAQIRAMKGTMAQREIAALYGVSPTTVSRIQRGDGWVHLC